ncbi:ABC transporter ATP-binding protein [Gordonia sp. VNQ95]|jgi:thiamine transport system ATP-binding protein|uniref:ABC transporter ATP-binding protein n=1 Tax=Gordonia TaxID=2053 RepID=UPI0032B50C9B
MLELSGLRVSYGSETIIDDLNWIVGGPDSLVTALLGPSGCGKSTVIRAVAGLQRPDAGTIRFDGVDLAGIPAHRRDFGVVFQDGQLFTGRSVAANVAYGLRMRRWSRAAIAERVAQMLDLVRLPGTGNRRVEALSGGQAQRVALARALAPRPRLLLLDEPLAALDRRLRDSLATEIAEIVREAGTPTIVVTHDHAEAALMGDSIAVMRDGAIVQSATPAQLWSTPVDAWAARFLGCTSVIPATATADARPGSDAGPRRFDTGLGHIDLDVAADSVELGLRAESVRATPVGATAKGSSAEGSAIRGSVLVVADLPSGPRLRVRTESGEYDAVGPASVGVGDVVTLRLVPERVAVIGS